MLSNKFLPTLNLVLAIIGYQLATSLATPFFGANIEGATNRITVPYRMITFIISTIVIIQSIMHYETLPKPDRTTKYLMVAWLLLILRLSYDLVIRTDFFLSPRESSRIWMYVWLLCIYCGFSVAVSIKRIDLHLALRLTAYALIICLTLTVLFNPLILADADDINERLEGNFALRTIAFGQMGLTAIIVGAYMIYAERRILYKFLIPAFLIFIGALISLRSGSRGPLICFVVIVLFVIITNVKRPIVGLIWAALILMLISVFSQDILIRIGRISPVLAQRLVYTTSNDDRAMLLHEAWERFVNSPFFGDRFAIIFTNGKFMYSHNMILDALMGMGIVGGIVFTIMFCSSLYDSYKLAKLDKRYLWIVLLLIQNIAGGMLSSAFYLKPLLTTLIIYVALSTSNYSPNSIQRS